MSTESVSANEGSEKVFLGCKIKTDQSQDRKLTLRCSLVEDIRQTNCWHWHPSGGIALVSSDATSKTCLRNYKRYALAHLLWFTVLLECWKNRWKTVCRPTKNFQNYRTRITKSTFSVFNRLNAFKSCITD